MPTTSAAPVDVDHLRDRVRLYLQVMLIIDLLSYVSDVVTPLVSPDAAMPALAAELFYLRGTVTAVLVGGWSLCRFGTPGRRLLIGLETGATLGLSLVYGVLALAYMGPQLSTAGPIFALIGAIMLLVVRASLVPSPVLRTVIIGLAAFGCQFPVSAHYPIDMGQLVEGIAFCSGAFVIVTAVTSHVIYGLRKQVHDAMQLGQYVLGTKLGEGGMGAVYQASHAMLRRQAAIKLIRPEVSGESGSRRDRARRRFEREANATAQLMSAHTVQLYDFGLTQDGAFYYVMELLDGIDLDTAVEQFGPMPPERVVHIIEQVCDSLEEAHAGGLVHRDIKPANLFLCRYGLRYDFVKVLDFGLVALGPEREPDANLTGEGLAGGTPAYIAPEQAAGVDIDGRTDLYALGCVMYWLLTGHAPFEGRSAMATILAHVNEEPAPPSTVTELEIPPQLEAVVVQCLEKKPGDRPGSAVELARLLSEALPRESWDQARAQKWWQTHRPATTVAATASTDRARAKVTKAFG